MIFNKDLAFNVGDLLALIVFVSPVAGFLPCLSLRFLTSKIPNSFIKIAFSFFYLLEITFVKLVITFSISASGSDTFHEIASINSFLFVLKKKNYIKL